jgi:hypothetical protein
MAVKQFIATRVTTLGAADKKDAFPSPYYGIMLERLATVMSVGDQKGAELPKLETNAHRGRPLAWTSSPGASPCR